MKKEPIHIPILCLIREKSMRKLLKENPKVKKFFKFASKKEIKNWEEECRIYLDEV